MDELIIDEYEIETETDNIYSEDIIDTGIEILNIEAEESIDDIIYDLIFQTESIESETVPETEMISPESETVPETELISPEPETVPETEMISPKSETVPETELISPEPETVPETEMISPKSETVPETELISPDPETVPETELISTEPGTVPETELITIEFETIPETELISPEPETVPETELITPEFETVPETELLTPEFEKVPETEFIIIENVAEEHLKSVGVFNDQNQADFEVEQDIQTEPVVQEEILSDNKEVEKEDPEQESEFSFIELVKDNSKVDSKDEILKDGSNTYNSIYDIDDIYNLIALRIPEDSRLLRSQHNIDDIYNLLSDSLPVNLLPSEHVRNIDDEVDIVEVVEESKRSSESAEETESETTSLSDIYDLIDAQNQILLSNQEIEIAILQNQKTISDNDNKMNTFLVSGVFAVLGAVVISNLFRGIR